MNYKHVTEKKFLSLNARKKVCSLIFVLPLRKMGIFQLDKKVEKEVCIVKGCKKRGKVMNATYSRDLQWVLRLRHLSDPD